MNELFAIDPDSPQDGKDVMAMLERFGMSKGRFIALYPDDWVSLLSKHALYLQGLERSRFIRLLDVHRDAFLSAGEHYSRAKPWIENALAMKQSRANVTKVLGKDPNKFKVDTLQRFLWDSDEDTEASRGAHIPMMARDYRIAARPLFQQSTEVHLADPFFSLRRSPAERDQRRCAVLTELFSEANQSSRCEEFVLHFKRDKLKAEEKQEKELIEDIGFVSGRSGANRLRVRFDLHDEMTHGRYIFSIKGGLQFDHGFDQDVRKTNHVHWLSAAELAPIHRMYGLDG